MQATSDEVLIARIATGDLLAMQVLYARHHVRVYRFVLRLVSNATTAEDLISEVFLARFKALSALRPEEELDEEAAASIADGADDPEVAVQKKDKSEILRHCLTRLTPEHRDIIDLVHYHEKSVEEVAEIVGIPEATVKTRMFYCSTRARNCRNC